MPPYAPLSLQSPSWNHAIPLVSFIAQQDAYASRSLECFRSSYVGSILFSLISASHFCLWISALWGFVYTNYASCKSYEEIRQVIFDQYRFLLVIIIISINTNGKRSNSDNAGLDVKCMPILSHLEQSLCFIDRF